MPVDVSKYRGFDSFNGFQWLGFNNNEFYKLLRALKNMMMYYFINDLMINCFRPQNEYKVIGNCFFEYRIFVRVHEIYEKDYYENTKRV